MSDGTGLIQLLCKVTTSGVFSPKHAVVQVCTVHFSFFNYCQIYVSYTQAQFV